MYYIRYARLTNSLISNLSHPVQQEGGGAEERVDKDNETRGIRDGLELPTWVKCFKITAILREAKSRGFWEVENPVLRCKHLGSAGNANCLR